MDIELPDGTILQGIPDGTPKAVIVAKLKANGYDTSKLDPAVQAGKAINSAVDSIPRQLGLTARYGLEGLGNAAQLVTEPLRFVTDRLTGQTGKTVPMGVLATQAADFLGLPSPASPTERVVGDAARLVAGTAGTIGVGGLGQKGATAIQSLPKLADDVVGNATGYFGDLSQAIKQSPAQIGNFLSQAPVSQLVSAAGAGLAGGASREAGGSTGGQVIASALGGLAGAGAVGLGNAIKTQATGWKNALMTPQQMDVKINEVLQKTGVDYSQVPERIRQSLRDELASSLRMGKDLDAQAVARLLDFKAAGLTPTRGMITLDPVQITREQNLAKMGANSADGQLQGLARIQNQNNAKLISNLNDLGASRGDTLRAGEAVTGSVLGTQAGLRGAEQSAWDAAKNSPGYRAPISSGAISDINKALGEQGMMPFMNPAISRYMEAFQTGQPFTPQDYRNLQSMLAREAAKGGNEGAAASIAQKALLKADLSPAGFVTNGTSVVTPGVAAGMRQVDGAAADAINAVNQARGATRAAYAFEDSNPLIRSVLSGGATSDPQRIAQRFVLGGTANEAADLVAQVGVKNLAPIKEAIVADLKSKALSGAADEVGKFSQSAFNRALNRIGDRKLSLLFTPEELQALRTNARVASFMQAQPAGSAVNNSNTGALLMGRGVDFLDKLAFIGPMVTPALKNIQVSYGNRQAQNLTPGLLATQAKQPLLSGLVAPSIAMGGLLSAPMSP